MIAPVTDGPPRPEDFLGYLMVLARSRLGPHQRARIDPSDIVQQTLLDAHRKLHQFRGSTDAQMAGWLRKMLSCRMADAFRALRRRKRDAKMERSINPQKNETCTRLENWLEAMQTSPIENASRNEERIRLTSALTRLPESQRDAIKLHHLQGLSLKETANRLGCTVGAVAGLLRRGLVKLRGSLADLQSGM